MFSQSLKHPSFISLHPGLVKRIYPQNLSRQIAGKQEEIKQLSKMILIQPVNLQDQAGKL